jgi:type I restriction enzyme M protein
MAVINHVQLSELEDEIRFDPQYYTPENMLFEEEIKAFQTIYLGSMALITDGQHGYFKLDENSEIRQITAKCIKEGLIDKTNADRLSHITHNNNLRSSLAVNDVLVTTAGTIGQIGLVTEEIPPANIDQDIGRIAIHNNGVSPYFVWAFLQSKFGRFQIERFTTGQVQTHLSLKKMKKLRIPLLSNHTEVEEIVKRFVESKIAAKELYTQVQELLEYELGLDKLRFDKPVGYAARFSELELSRRFDSEHYYPAFDNLKANLPKGERLVPLGPLLTFCQRGKQPIYSEHGLPVLNSKHILENKLILEGNRYAKSNPVPSLQIQHGDVLINGTGRGTIGRTAPYLIEEHQAIPDNHVTILRSPTLDPAYLSFYLNSLAGKLQVEKHQRGSSGQLELYPFDIRKFQIWEAPQSIQQEIRRLYEQATESARQSRNLLDQAKSRVEQLIEEAARL